MQLEILINDLFMEIGRTNAIFNYEALRIQCRWAILQVYKLRRQFTQMNQKLYLSDSVGSLIHLLPPPSYPCTALYNSNDSKLLNY